MPEPQWSYQQLITEEKYDVKQCIRDATIVIKNSKEPPLTLTINLTSPLVREEAEKQAAGGRFEITCLMVPLTTLQPQRQQMQMGWTQAGILFIGPSMELGDIVYRLVM